jgi:hypothetical protein
MIKTISLLAAFCLLVSLHAVAQQESETTAKKKLHGTFFVNWGYHRDAYTTSTIQFKGNDSPGVPEYDFTFHNAKSHDKHDMKNFLQKAPTLPQYVLNFGYFFNDKKDLGIEVGWNHLKYVVTDNQVIHMTGTIDEKYYDLDTLVTPDFVHFEHTNGNNYLIISLLKRVKMLSSKNQQHKLSAIFGAGLGGLIPKSDSYITINNKKYHNDGPFRLSGWVVGVSAAARYDFFKYFFLESSIKGAFANYTNVKLYDRGRANHHFFSVQSGLSLGINVPIGQGPLFGN